MDSWFSSEFSIVIFVAIVVLAVAVSLLLIAHRRPKRTKETGIGEAPAAPKALAPEPAAVQAPAAAPSLTDTQRVQKGLERTKAFFRDALDRAFSGSEGKEFLDNLEEVLLTADIGVQFSERVITELKNSFGLSFPGRDQIKQKLAKIMIAGLPAPPAAGAEPLALRVTPHVLMVVGVNGAGKTTTVGKLCERYRRAGKRVLVGAADTFRAAAIEQLKTWIERVGAEGVFQKQGTDPSAVAFDSVQAAQSRGADVCIIDTAGRLHTKTNLMDELAKMKRVVAKAMPSAPHDVWLVVDGSTGQNALNQAREFHQHLGLTGIIVTKLDGSAKGGAVLAIASELKVPITFIGVGESAEDLIPFHGEPFVDAILGEA